MAVLMKLPIQNRWAEEEDTQYGAPWIEAWASDAAASRPMGNRPHLTKKGQGALHYYPCWKQYRYQKPNSIRINERP